jgi:hypothetical protein
VADEEQLRILRQGIDAWNEWRRRRAAETVKVLAGLARFVIADITDATEVRRELDNIVPQFTSLAIQPILLRGQREFVSMVHLGKFPWVLQSFEYDTTEHLDGFPGRLNWRAPLVRRPVVIQN